MRMMFVLFSILIVVFTTACQTQEIASDDEQENGQLQLYENKELGITFKYPSNFKIYQSNEDTLRIDTGYKNTDPPAVQAVLSVSRVNQFRETTERIEARVNPDFSALTNSIKIIEKTITPEGRAEIKRQMEYTKKTFPDGYRLQYGDKTVEEATEESVKNIQEQIESLRELQTKKRTFKIESKGIYDLVNVEGGQSYYLLSDKGTFLITSTIDNEVWKPVFERRGIYQEYKNQFNQIINSIKII